MNKLYTTLLIIALSAVLAFGQEQKEEKAHKYLGIGVRTAVLNTFDLISNPIPVNRIVLNVDVHKYARVELQYGMINQQSEREYSYWNGTANVTTTLKPGDKSSLIGGGIFGLYPKDKVKLMAGIRYAINNYYSEYPDFGSAVPVLQKASGKMNLISGVIGGEYYLADCFSIGAEFSILSVKDVYKDNPTANDMTTTTKLSEGNIIIRFYPF